MSVSTIVPREGVTLLELLVVIVLLGVMAGMIGLSVRAPEPTGHVDGSGRRGSEIRGMVAAARRQAVASGRAVTVVADTGARARTITALPDGTVLGAEGLGFDALAGRPADTPEAAVTKEVDR